MGYGLGKWGNLLGLLSKLYDLPNATMLSGPSSEWEKLGSAVLGEEKSRNEKVDPIYFLRINAADVSDDHMKQTKLLSAVQNLCAEIRNLEAELMSRVGQRKQLVSRMLRRSRG